MGQAVAPTGKLFNLYCAETNEEAAVEYKEGLMWYMDERENRGMFGFSNDGKTYEYYINHRSVIVGTPEKYTLISRNLRNIQVLTI